MLDERIQAEDDNLITADVARAIEEKEFVPYVQPQFDLATGRVVGCEALVRWTLPEDGTVVPASLFVPSLERTHTICGLDWFMIEEMCLFLGKVAGTAAEVPVSLNISAQHAGTSDFGVRLAASADWPGVPHELVCVEVSEHKILSGSEAVRDLVASVAEQGLCVIVDNCELKQGVDGICIPGVTVAKVAASCWREAESLDDVIARAHQSGVHLCAEGVETEEDKQKVQNLGIGRAQGYYLGRPMSLDSFVELCKA